MVNVQKLKAEMVLKGFNQRLLAAEITKRGYKISENTLSSKLTGSSRFDCDLADVICEILELEDLATRADIFLA